MKNIIFACAGFMIMAFSLLCISRDGTYHGISRSIYTQEPYYAHTSITIRDGKIEKVTFLIRDSSKHVTFDETYEKYFATNPKYIQQCRNDWKGVQSYPDSLLKHQDINRVDAISGATWSYNLFKASVNEAFKQASR